MASTAKISQNEGQPTQFETRRAELVGQIGDSLEQVLMQINALNRSLEGIIEIGNEFASVEALWSQFETVLGMDQQQQQQQQTEASGSRTQADGRNGDGG